MADAEFPRLTITWPAGIEEGTDEANDHAMALIYEFAAALGYPAKFEVWYPHTTEADYDVLNVTGPHTIEPVPPYDPVVAADVATLIELEKHA